MLYEIPKQTVRWNGNISANVQKTNDNTRIMFLERHII